MNNTSENINDIIKYTIGCPTCDKKNIICDACIILFHFKLENFV